MCSSWVFFWYTSSMVFPAGPAGGVGSTLVAVEGCKGRFFSTAMVAVVGLSGVSGLGEKPFFWERKWGEGIYREGGLTVEMGSVGF
jgi:hypothetical protein